MNYVSSHDGHVHCWMQWHQYSMHLLTFKRNITSLRVNCCNIMDRIYYIMLVNCMSIIIQHMVLLTNHSTSGNIVQTSSKLFMWRTKNAHTMRIPLSAPVRMVMPWKAMKPA